MIHFKHKIFITGKIPQVGYELLTNEFDVTMYDGLKPMSKEEIMSGLANKDALLPILSDQIDADVIKCNPNLKIIANYGAGYNNIDINTATVLKIPVTNTPAVSTNATAELTLGLILAISRRIVEGDKTVRAGQFTGWAPMYYLGTELTGKTLGIIGMGSIGQAVAKKAQAFDMNIIYYDKTRLDDKCEKATGYRYLDMDEVIKQADYLSLHLSYDSSLHHLLDQKRIASMKPSAYIINAARGPLIDESALLVALQNKKIAGAALDVYEYEPKITPGLGNLDNVVLAPHIGNATVETREAMAKVAAQNIIAVLKGNRPINCVNPEIYEKN